MRQFKDNAGRTWTIAVNVDSIKRVRTLVKDDDGNPVNLLAAIEGHLLEKLVESPILLCDVVYALCKPDADALLPNKVTDEDFGRAMAGEAIDGATVALLEDLSDFFPASKRPMLQTAIRKLAQLQKIAMDEAVKRLESPILEQRLRQTIARDLSGVLPESSESTPAP
ncbi:MAG: hypothetical protein NT031_20560 [Planctomycetota bacterium]|nr:hypothetical protein [Planctomycetota bacterium]